MRHLDGYLARVLIETDDQPKRWGDVADPWQRADVDAIKPALTRLVDENAPEPIVRRAWWERPRAHAKTSDLILLVLHVGLFSARRRRMVWVASDQDQGLEGLDAARMLFRHNAWMRELADIRTDKIVNKRTESSIMFTTSDVGSAFGWANVDVFVFDELVTWKDERLWDAMFSAAGKRKRSLLFVGTNAGFDPSWQATRRASVADDPRWHFSALHGPQASWLTADQLDEQRRHLPDNAYQRLWKNVWVSDQGGDCFTSQEIAACVTLNGPQEPEPGWNHILALDLAKRRDTCAAVVVGRHCGHRERIVLGQSRPMTTLEEILLDREHFAPAAPEVRTKLTEGTGRLRVMLCKTWTPTKVRKVSLDAVKEWALSQHERFRFRAVALDPSQGELLGEQLAQKGINVEMVDQTGGALLLQATTLHDAITERTIDLLNHPDLIADLKRARVVEKSYGWRLVSPRHTGSSPGTVHGDLLSALSIGVAVSKKYRRRPGPPRVDRPLVCA